MPCLSSGHAPGLPRHERSASAGHCGALLRASRAAHAPPRGTSGFSRLHAQCSRGDGGGKGRCRTLFGYSRAMFTSSPRGHTCGQGKASVDCKAVWDVLFCEMPMWLGAPLSLPRIRQDHSMPLAPSLPTANPVNTETTYHDAIAGAGADGGVALAHVAHIGAVWSAAAAGAGGGQPSQQRDSKVYNHSYLWLITCRVNWFMYPSEPEAWRVCARTGPYHGSGRLPGPSLSHAAAPQCIMKLQTQINLALTLYPCIISMHYTQGGCSGFQAGRSAAPGRHQVRGDQEQWQ